MQRYAEEVEEDEEEYMDEENSFENSINARDCTSTPIPPGREKEDASTMPLAQAARRPVPTAPSLIEDQSTLMISLPPTMIKMHNGMNEKEGPK